MPDLPSCNTFFGTLRVRGGAKNRILGNFRVFIKVVVLNFFAKISPNSSLARGHDIHCWNRLSLDIKGLIVKKVNNRDSPRVSHERL